VPSTGPSIPQTPDRLSLFDEFLKAVTGTGHQPCFHARGQAHLCHVDVAARIDPDPVRGTEIAGGSGMVPASPACLKFATAVENTHPPSGCSQFWGTGTRPATGAEAQFGDMHQAGAINEDLARPGHIGPFTLVNPRRREELNPAVLPVGHIHGAVSTHGN